MRFEAVIIGAGMSGLAAGIRLAQSARRVAVFERHSSCGGLNSYYERGEHLLDSGLHALTNYVAPGTKGAPLGRLLRQLRIRRAELEPQEQTHSEILFPGLRLEFSNDPQHLADEVARAFPAQRDAFAGLLRELGDYDLARPAPPQLSAREELRRRIDEPLLREALLLPVLYYGSAREEDIDWHSFVVLFRSIFLEGMWRPRGGIRTLLDLLVRRFQAEGGELHMRSGVARILTRYGAVCGVELDDGSYVETDLVLSSAGFVETMRLCDTEHAARDLSEEDVGRISVLETISILDRPAAELGHRACTSFFSYGERPPYRCPEGLVELGSGVISAPGNFRGADPAADMHLRLTVLANPDLWSALPRAEYKREKERLADLAIESAAKHTVDWRAASVFRDVFTPKTIQRFTGHLNGALYGSPRKQLDGRTGVDGLVLCGTDQGYLGVIGAMISGITMANSHALVPV